MFLNISVKGRKKMSTHKHEHKSNYDFSSPKPLNYNISHAVLQDNQKNFFFFKCLETHKNNEPMPCKQSQ